ncbi:MAG TPA: acetylornithine/succinylornithine family transaminase [Planctomycetota bacterium]|nr:acetylornithine/succinylornithine family transaminase [Planctomycetota bacterium]
MSTPAAQPSHLLQNYARQDVRFVRGKGCRLWDDAGREYLDAFAGVAVSALGHAHPGLTAAIARQAGELIHVSNHYRIQEQEDLARELVQRAFPGRMLFCNSGTEANEAAYKIVRVWGNQADGGVKRRMIAFHNGFHGRTLGSLSITANPAYREPFEPLPPAEFLPFGDVAALTAAMAAGGVAGVFVEPIQGEGGLHVAPPGFLAAVRALCDRHGALLVIDEVQTGIGRTGAAFAWQHDGVAPDLMALAKGLGGGVPIGAVMVREAIAGLLKPGMHGTTFGGNPLACAAALTVVREVLTPRFLADITARGRELVAGLAGLFGADRVRGRGLLIGVQLDQAPGPLVIACRAQGLVVGPSGGNTLRLAPPLIITAAEIGELVEKLAAAKKAAGF